MRGVNQLTNSSLALLEFGLAARSEIVSFDFTRGSGSPSQFLRVAVPRENDILVPCLENNQGAGSSLASPWEEIVGIRNEVIPSHFTNLPCCCASLAVLKIFFSSPGTIILLRTAQTFRNHSIFPLQFQTESGKLVCRGKLWGAVGRFLASLASGVEVYSAQHYNLH